MLRVSIMFDESVELERAPCMLSLYEYATDASLPSCNDASHHSAQISLRRFIMFSPSHACDYILTALQVGISV